MIPTNHSLNFLFEITCYKNTITFLWVWRAKSLKYTQPKGRPQAAVGELSVEALNFRPATNEEERLLDSGWCLRDQFIFLSAEHLFLRPSRYHRESELSASFLPPTSGIFSVLFLLL